MFLSFNLTTLNREGRHLVFDLYRGILDIIFINPKTKKFLIDLPTNKEEAVTDQLSVYLNQNNDLENLFGFMRYTTG